MIGSELNYLLFGLSILLLGVASWQDLKSRDVTDWIWYCMIGGGILIHVTQLILQISANEFSTTWIINILFSLALSLLLLGIAGLSLLLLGITSWQDLKSRDAIEWIWFCIIGG